MLQSTKSQEFFFLTGKFRQIPPAVPEKNARRPVRSRPLRPALPPPGPIHNPMLRPAVLRTALLGCLGLIIAVVYFFYNLSILNRFLDHDIVNYYVNVEKLYMFNPHHLLFTTVSKLIYELARTHCGYDQPAMFLLQLLNLGVASFALGFLFFSLAILGRRVALAAVFTALVGFSHGFWFYAHVNDTPAIPTSLALITFFSALFLAQGFDPRRAWLDWIKALGLGVLHCVAVGYHQQNILLWFAVALFILFPLPVLSGRRRLADFFVSRLERRDVPGARPPGRRFVFLGTYTVTVTLLTMAMYFWAGAVHHGYPLDDRKAPLPGVPGGGNFYAWLFLYSHYSNNSWGNAKDTHKADLALRGVSNAFFKNSHQFWQRIKDRLDFDEDRSPDLQILATLGGLLLLFCVSLPILFMRLRVLPFAALAWFALYGTLAAWWEPLHFEHWVNASVGFWLAIYSLALGWLLLIERVRALHDAVYLVLVVAGASLAGLLWLVNYERAMLPQSRQIIFGHWEDFYLKQQFTGLLDGWVQDPVYAVGENPGRAWDDRVARMHQLRGAMFDIESDAHFKQNSWRFEKTVRALEVLFPDRPEVARFQKEVNVMQAGRAAWLRYHGRDAGEANGEPEGKGEAAPAPPSPELAE